MIGKQNRDPLYFYCIFEGKGKGVSSKAYRRVQQGRGGGVMKCEYIGSLFIFLLFFFAWKRADLTNT